MQARRRVLLFLCSPVKRFYWTEGREIEASLDSRAELLRHLLGLKNAAHFQKLCALDAVTVSDGSVRIQVAGQQISTLPAYDICLQQLSASVEVVEKAIFARDFAATRRWHPSQSSVSTAVNQCWLRRACLDGTGARSNTLAAFLTPPFGGSPASRCCGPGRTASTGRRLSSVRAG
jgi:hypothetical protein